MAKSHTYNMFPFEDRPPPLLSGSDTCRRFRHTYHNELLMEQHRFSL